MKTLARLASKTGLFLCIVSPALADQVFTLPSGDKITVESMGPWKFGDGQTALVMNYQSGVAIDDIPALARESDEVWNRYVVDVAKAGFDNAALSAGSQPQGTIIKHTRRYNFVFRKIDGTWRKNEFDPGETPKLTDALARRIMTRIDAAIDHGEMNAVRLFLGNNWMVTVNENGKVLGQEGPADFLANTAEVLAALKNYKHTRTIDKVTVSDDGQTATVTSEELTTGTNNGNPYHVPQHSVDTMAIQGKSIVLTSSQSTNLETSPVLQPPPPGTRL